MTTNTFAHVEEMRRKRSFRMTLGIHTVVFALAFLPFISQIPDTMELQDIIINFQSTGSSLEGAPKSAKLASAFTPKAIEEKVVEEVKALPIKTIESDAPSLPTTKKIDVKEQEIKPEVKKKAKKSEKVKTKSDPVAKKSDTATKGKGDNDSGESSAKGEANGKGKDGKGKDAEGKGGKGAGDGLFEGDGILTRKIIESPNLSEIISKKGTMSVNVCVNRLGRVTYAEYNKENSTIKDLNLVRKALEASAEYLFERKLDGASRECGRLTFIIDFIDKSKKK